MTRLALIAATLLACSDTTPPPPPPPSPSPSPPPSPPPSPSPSPSPSFSDLTLTTDDGVHIRASLWRPATATAPAVVFVHQLGSTRAEWQPFVDAMRDDFTILTLDMRGHGDSTSTTAGTTLDRRRFDTAAWAKIPLDVKAAVAHLRGLDPPPTRIGVAGGSIGSSAVLLYAATDPDIAAIALFSPGRKYRGLATLPAAAALTDSQHVLAIAATGDAASAAAAEAINDTAAASEPIVYEGRRHGVSMIREKPDLKATVVAFFRRHLAD